MRKREIFLDFTSLLDVIMIILFFFILFSSFEIETAKNEAEQKKIEYETEKSAVEEERERIDNEWEKLLQLDENAVKNEQALLNYQNIVLSINLVDKLKNDTLYVNIRRGDKKIKEFEYTKETLQSTLDTEINDAFELSELKEDEVIICTLTYSGDDLYSDMAVKGINKTIEKLQKEYSNLYYAAINTTK